MGKGSGCLKRTNILFIMTKNKKVQKEQVFVWAFDTV
jgi:hypothetical protein